MTDDFKPRRVNQRRDTEYNLGNHERRIAKLERSLPRINASGLPPWIDWSADFKIGMQTSSGGGDTAPTDTVQSAWIMVQTDDGQPLSFGNNPVDHGTVLADFYATITAAGQGKTGGTSTGAITVTRGTVVDGVKPIHAVVVPPTPIGFAEIVDVSSIGTATIAYWPALILGDGTLRVTGVADNGPPTGAENLARFASNGGVVPAWPFAFTNGDIISGSLFYPLETG